jgi:glycosyltransferase involved in cell wall biosynthesis
MRLSVIVPVYNEAKTVADIMQRLAGALPDAQVIYVDDGSKDDSLNILKAHARPHDIVLTKPNGGKGSAIRLGLEKSEGMYTVIQDADLEYTPLDIPALLKEAEAHPGSAIFGSRFLTDNPVMYKRFLMGNKVLSLIVSILFGRRITDSYTCSPTTFSQFPTTSYWLCHNYLFCLPSRYRYLYWTGYAHQTNQQRSCNRSRIQCVGFGLDGRDRPRKWLQIHLWTYG